MKNQAVWTALITPFQNQKIDFDTLDALVDEQNSAGNGIVVLGTTGEGLSLHPMQQKEIVRRVCQHNSETPPIVRASSNCMEEINKWIRWCNALPLGGLMCPLPPYVKPGPEGQYSWFRNLLDQSAHPVMLYNHPGRTAVSIDVDIIKRLAEHKNFWALKEASGYTDALIAYAQAAPHVLLLSGDDAFLPIVAPLGAKGLVSMASNAWPDATQAYAQKCLRGDMRASDVALWTKVGKILSSSSNPIPLKALMHKQGKIRTSEVLPPLSCRDFTDMNMLENIHQKVEGWYAQQN